MQREPTILVSERKPIVETFNRAGNEIFHQTWKKHLHRKSNKSLSRGQREHRKENMSELILRIHLDPGCVFLLALWINEGEELVNETKSVQVRHRDLH